MKEKMFQSKTGESTSGITKMAALLIMIHMQTYNKIQQKNTKKGKFMVVFWINRPFDLCLDNKTKNKVDHIK